MRSAVLLLLLSIPASAAVLRAGNLSLNLSATRVGIPYIEKVTWRDNGRQILTDSGSTPLAAWLASDIQPGPVPASRWAISGDALFHRAEYIRAFGPLHVTWVVEAARTGSLLRLHVRIANTGSSPRKVAWFPAWVADWQIAGLQSLRSWESLSFRRREIDLTAGAGVTLESRLHSSEERGSNPYWTLAARDGRLFFGLEWSGGWRADFYGGPSRFALNVRLPEDETQLTLAPSESVDGPALILVLSPHAAESLARRDYMTQRAALAASRYPAPQPRYLFSYNHWYSVRFDLNREFFTRQLTAMPGYGFDAFVIDAGWYPRPGNWIPDPAKFQPGEFESAMRSIKQQGLIPGLWSCPQFVRFSEGELRDIIDVPGHFARFIQADLIDLSGSDYPSRLREHVSAMRNRYSMDWWKYDQLLFTSQTRAGAMKNVLAFQAALAGVRRANPNLVIENCQSGGRMINEFTVFTAQQQWLRDGGNTGLPHARQNLEVALGALDFVFPWAALRWTNNPDRIDPADEELLRFYCRTAMIGSWGISADLPRIAPRQREVILKEAANYRRLNALRGHSLLYEMVPPSPAAPLAHVTFASEDGRRAAVLAFRWDGLGEIDTQVPLAGLAARRSLRVFDADQGTWRQVDSANPTGAGLKIRLPAGRMSAMLFVE